MDQHIEALRPQDVQDIEDQLRHASDLVASVTGDLLTGQLADLDLIQRVIDAGNVEPEATYSLQSLGMAFGRVFARHHDHYGWCRVEDEHGTEAALRYKETSLLCFPLSIISNRVEDGEDVNVRALYDGLQHQLDQIRVENYSEE